MKEEREVAGDGGSNFNRGRKHDQGGREHAQESREQKRRGEGGGRIRGRGVVKNRQLT